MHILGLCSFQVQKACKVGMYRLRSGKICKAGHGFPACPDGSGKERRGVALSPEYGHNALCSGPFSLPVAPSGGLEDGVQSGLLPVDGREVYVHTSFNQRGGHHPAGKPLLQASADLLQLGTAVGGVHQSGEMEQSFSGQSGKDLLGGFSGVYDTQDLVLVLKLGG